MNREPQWHDEQEERAGGPAGEDPRLKIPEVLTKPVAAKKPNSILSPQTDESQTQMKAAKSWAIAMNFVYGVVGMGLLGWVVQEFWLTNARPWPLLVGLLVGLIGGFVRFIQEALKANREN